MCQEYKVLVAKGAGALNGPGVEKLAYGDSKFVGIRAGTTFVYLSDKDGTWRISPAVGVGLGWSKVAHGTISGGIDRFVAIPSNTPSTTYVLYSSDGITWSQTNVPSATWYNLCFGKEKFILSGLGSDKYIYTSSNGMSWQKSKNSPRTTFTYSSLGYGNGVTVLFGYNSGSGTYDGSSSFAFYSEDDGDSWTETSMPVSAKWSDILYGKEKFVAISSGSNNAAYSYDGKTWTETHLPSASDWCALAYGQDKFVAISKSGSIAYSLDGENWAEVNSAALSSWNWNSITYGNRIFVGSAQSGAFAYSIDGINWVACI